MLTERDATQDKAAAAVWAGMQAAADTTHAQITSLTMQGPDTAANADIYINTLALRGCSMVVSVGRIPAQGALQRAAYWPATTVVAIPGVPSALPTTKAPHNLVWAQDTTNKAMTSKIQGLLTAASRAASS